MQESPPPKRLRGYGIRSRLIGAVLLVGLLTAAVFLPLPFFFGFLPGPVRDVEDLVDVRGVATYSSEGSLYLTTVSLDTEVTIVDWIAAVVDPTKSIVSKEQVTGGQSLKESQRLQELQMENSKRNAEVVALGALGLAFPTGDGAHVDRVVPDAPADGSLQPGDVIVSVGGEPTGTSCDVGVEIGEHEPGQEIEVEVERDGSMIAVTVQAGTHPNIPGRAYLGIGMSEEYEFDPDFDVRFETGEIAGPSAGLVFALALYDRLTPDDLTNGRPIAGTGTIACDGSVGPIGGIEQKVAGAEARGAEIFLAPKANAPGARAAADDIEVVAIETFDDAIDYLEALD
jgi:PDZ domain-containing protein